MRIEVSNEAIVPEVSNATDVAQVPNACIGELWNHDMIVDEKFANI